MKPLPLTRPFPILPLSLGLLCAANLATALPVLFDFSRETDPGLVATTDARATRAADGTRTVLRVVTGHEQPWPGITLRAPRGYWNLSPFAELAVELANSGTNSVIVSCRVDNPGADGTRQCVTAAVNLGPGQRSTLFVPLKRATDDKLEGKLFGMRGYPVAAGGPGTVDASNITQLLLFVTRPAQEHSFDVLTVRARGHYTPPTAFTTDTTPFFPFLDTFGQYRHKDWPGKVKSLGDLTARRDQEARELEAQPGPANWDRYGGWRTGPQRRATGFFRTEKVDGKWWLIDPDGRLFFSHGIDCVRMIDSTPIDGREQWFDDFPGALPEFAEFRSRGRSLKGHYAGKNPECFAFGGANLARKYGHAWKETYAALVHRRLRSWGINTIANWSDLSVCALRRTPYTDSVGSGGTRMLEGSEGYWGKFPDVFDASFADTVRRGMESKKNRSAGDPWCLGYFSDNEMSWGDELSLGVAALRSPAGQPAKKAFIRVLEEKYGAIENLNSAWGAHYGSWDALRESRDTPDRDKARGDLTAFYTRMAEQYFRTVRDAIKAVAPNQLYLGCRFAWVNARAAAAAAKYCDVVSYNLYRRSVADFEFNGGADVPLIIGEFHFGALDRGMFHTGLVPVADQAARADAYREYVRGALRHPQFVGCHWFQYMDEPVTGRVYDEENYQIGFVDVADTPYVETIAACRAVGYHLYQ